MLLSLFRTSFFIIVAFNLTFSVSAAKNSPVNFLESDIDEALTQRNQILLALHPGSNEIDIRKWDTSERQQVLNSVDRLAPSPFTVMLKGILQYVQNDPGYENLLKQSILMASESPGTTWLIFLECSRYQLIGFDNQALAQLEKQIFMSGAQSSQIISNHLLQLGKIDKKLGNTDKARYFFSNAHRFNRQSTHALVEQISLSFPFHLNDFSAHVTLYLQTISQSWLAQLELLSVLYNVIKLWCTLFIVFVTLFAGCKYLPKALHTAAHWFPDGTPVWLRPLLVSSILFSFVSFGMLPLFWLITFLVWRYLSRAEMILYGLVLTLVIISPVNNMISSRLSDAMNPDLTLQTYSKCINDRLTESQYLQMHQAPEHRNNSHLRGIINAAYKIKNGSGRDAIGQLTQLCASMNNDPVAHNLTGIAYLLNMNVDSAEVYFQKVLSYDQTNHYALFNLSRCALLRNDATTSMDYLKKAANEKPDLINNFIQQNDTYFSTSWPPLRQVLLPDYTPSFFWSRLFFPHVNNRGSDVYHWGLSFFGFPPMISLLLFIICTLVLIISYLNIDNVRNPRRLFDCKYCGRIICRKCTGGILCPVCSVTSNKRSPEISVEASRSAIVTKATTFRNLKQNICNFLIPGSGMLLDVNPRPIEGPLTILMASLTYTIWTITFTSIPLNWVATTELFLLLIVPIMVHLYAGIRFIPGIFSAAIKLKSVQNIPLPKEH